MDSNSEINEFLEQVNYALSNKFMEKWRFRFSNNFIGIFQSKLLEALKKEKPISKTSLLTHYVSKHKYARDEVLEFFNLIDISLYYPLIYGP
jgi:hypothetical protein